MENRKSKGRIQVGLHLLAQDPTDLSHKGVAEKKHFYNNMVAKLNQTNIEDRTLQFWSQLAENQYSLSELSTSIKNKRLWINRAIKSLKKIPKDKRTFSDFRMLAKYENDFASFCNDSENQVLAYKNATKSLRCIPGEERSEEDWRTLAAYQHKVASSSRDENDKFRWFKRAIKSLSRIKNHTENDIRALCECQTNAGCACNDDQQSFDLFKNAITVMEKIKDNWTEDDLRLLSVSQNNAGIACGQSLEQRRLHLEAINTLKKIKKWLEIDWRHLANVQVHIGYTYEYNDAQEELKWYKKAVQSLQKIPKDKMLAEDWDALADFQYAIGLVYKNLNDWESAQLYFHSALESQEINYPLIRSIYKNLKELFSQISLTEQIYNFAEAVFSGVAYPAITWKTLFFQTHLTVIGSPSLERSHLSQKLFRVMSLMKQYATRADFPNKTIKDWLTDKTNAEIFDKKLQILNEMQPPLSLSATLEASQTLVVAVTMKLKELEIRIEELEKKNAELTINKEQNEQSSQKMPRSPQFFQMRQNDKAGIKRTSSEPTVKYKYSWE